MNFGEGFAEVMSGPSGTAILGVVGLALVEFATGVLKAIASGQFKLELVDTWVRKTAAGRVLPIALLLLFGAFMPDLNILGVEANVLTLTGMTAAAAFAVAAVASIVDNVNPRAVDSPPPVE